MGTDSIIYFRTDGNSHIATGHLVRCLSVARAFALLADENSSRICFLVSDRESALLLRNFFDIENEFEVKILNSAYYNDLDRELPELVSFLSAKDSVFFLDSYYVTKTYLETLGRLTRLVFLDDLRLFDYPVDMIINYDVLSPKALAAYKAFYSQAKIKLLGSSYTPLRQQFSDLAGTGRNCPAPLGHLHSAGSLNAPPAVRLLISSGGSDPNHTCLKLADRLLASFAEAPVRLCLEVVLGALSTDKEVLLALAEKQPLITIHEKVTNMARLMASCDLAISAAGTTLYELCALAIPSACFILADNQKASAQAFAEAGAIPLLGDVRTESEKVMQSAAEWTASMLNGFCREQFLSPSMKQASASMRQLVDGKGSDRIARQLLQLLQESSPQML